MLRPPWKRMALAMRIRELSFFKIPSGLQSARNLGNRMGFIFRSSHGQRLPLQPRFQT